MAAPLESMSESFETTPPTKSSLSEYRQKISSEFFKNIYDQFVETFKCRMDRYKGYHIVGVDGDEFDILPSKDLLKHGYRGYPLKDGQETHYLKMYTVRCVDLLSSVVIDFRESHANNEISLAIPMIESLPPKTISIYDRFYLSGKIIEAHEKEGQFFLARCKKGSTFKEVVSFYASNKRRSYFYYDDIKINLIKVKNPNGEDIVLATNISIDDWSNKELANLYTLRWDNETSNRDSTSTLKLEQWHTKFYNGILQEIYVHLTMINVVKMTIFIEGGYEINLETNETKKSNFKFIYSIIMNLFPKMVRNAFSYCLQKLRFNINRTIELRKRRSRSYLRETKKRGKIYKNVSVVSRRT